MGKLSKRLLRWYRDTGKLYDFAIFLKGNKKVCDVLHLTHPLLSPLLRVSEGRREARAAS